MLRRASIRGAGLLAAALASYAALGASGVRADDRLVWQPSYSRFSAMQFASLGGLGGGVLAEQLLLDAPSHARWRGGILLDEGAQESFAATTASGRAVAGQVSDVLLWTLMLYPFFDSWVVAGQVHENTDIAFQMTAISMQSLLLTQLTTGLAKNTVARQRPDAALCLDGEDCSGTPNSSFFSGHTSGAFTGAGLICAHHQNLALYGGGAADTVACAVSMLMAAAVGTLRVVSDRHHLSDVVVGAVVGTASGYLLPNLTNYDFGTSQTAAVANTSVMPMATSRALGISYMLQF